MTIYLNATSPIHIFLQLVYIYNPQFLQHKNATWNPSLSLPSPALAWFPPSFSPLSPTRFSGRKLQKLQSTFFIGTSAFYPLNLCLTWLFTPVNHTLRDAVISLPSALQHYFRHNSSCAEPCGPAQSNCTPFIECYLCLFGLP